MKRISIEVTEQEQQRLKAMAALQGQSIKDFVLASTIGQAGDDEELALSELEALLERRLASARAGGLSSRTVGDIAAQVKQEFSGPGPDA